MLMINETVEMVVREMDSVGFNELYCDEQVVFLDVNFDTIIESLEYNEAFSIIDELNNYHPYNTHDIVYITDDNMFALVLEQY